jgi:hypothetical protein
MRMLRSAHVLPALLSALLLAPLPRAAFAQHVHPPDAAPPARISFGAGVHAVPLLTHAVPLLQGESMTEAYLTQPTLLGSITAPGGVLRVQAAISLEALTIGRGELGPGSYGEGYVDRRHPHTYLHELVASAIGDVGVATLSATIGRGFVPFGTDDPMMRPFVKFPVNHHLCQILERLVAIGGVHARGVMLEAALFNGNEPLDARDMGSFDRFGDSWAARVTVQPVPGLELQGSRAWVVSPEMPHGDGWDQRKWSASARYENQHTAGLLYALVEWKRTTEVDRGADMFDLGSLLAEAAVSRGGWTPALRVERSQRPEEMRTVDPFRTEWPHSGGSHGMGTTCWTIASARLQKSLRAGALAIAPFVEASIAHVREIEGGLFDPTAFYGGRRITTLNVGARLAAGEHPARMGRYGVAALLPGHMH